MSILYSSSFSVDDLATKWTVVVGTWTVTGGVLRCSAGATPRIIRNNTGAYAATADMLVTAKYAAGTSFDGGPAARYQSGADTCYYLDETATNVNLYRRIAGVDSASLATLGPAILTDSYGLQVTGTGATVTLKIFKNGVQQGSDILDSNAARITSAGFGGVVLWSNTGNQDFDDFSVDDLVAAPGPSTTGPLGMFDPELRHEAWFDKDLISAAAFDGFYDNAFIDTAAAGAAVSDVPLATMIPMAIMAM